LKAVDKPIPAAVMKKEKGWIPLAISLFALTFAFNG
jgi:hypothetical protein